MKLFNIFAKNPIEFCISLIFSLKLIISKLIFVRCFRTRYDLLSYSLNIVKIKGCYLEFGVFKGESINYIARCVPNDIVFGFDSFEGLPEDWKINFPKGTFKIENIPKVENNVKLIIGYFQDVLDEFLERESELVSFIHMDADIYSSTKYVLNTLLKYNRLVKGTIIQFDEYYRYLEWHKKGEFKAFHEILEEYNLKYKYIGWTLIGRQVSIIIL